MPDNKTTRDRIIGQLLAAEGSAYVPDDAGAGPSRYGLTQRWLRSVGLPDHPKDITRQRAMEIYRTYWWEPMKLDQINNRLVAKCLLFSAVNIGKERAIRMWQQALGDNMKHVRVDGRMGPKTIEATNHTGPLTIPYFLNRLEAYYSQLTKKPDYKKYAAGWQKRMNLMLKDA